jgi:uncharacterized protein
VPPSVWLPLVWGGEKEPVFESSAQAERIIGTLMRRFNEISRMFGEEATGFEPLLYTRAVDGETKLFGDDWCVGFMKAVDFSFDDWQPLFNDQPECALLAPILTLGTEVGWKELDVAPDPEAEREAALEMLGPAVEAIHEYWRLRGRTKAATLKEAHLRPRTLRPRRNDPCPGGSGRKFKRCCAARSAV